MAHISRTKLLSTVALCSVLFSSGAWAQAASSGSEDSLEQVVVTATRQISTVNQVSLSISAVTDATLDQKGINNFSDLLTTVPGISITNALGTGMANVAIRGIFQGRQGAATTGFYLDDTPLQKRNVGGNFGSSGNGTPLPPLFDLQRVEVLRGPQGTLYGGSSEGGTIRFITPAPSLDAYHVYVKTDMSTVQDGGTGYEAGIAVGGPIVQDKLGFRVSIYKDSQAGWIDHANAFTQQITGKDTNSVQTWEFHGALLWQPSAEMSALLSLFNSQQTTKDTTNSYNLSTKDPIIVPTECYNTSSVTAASPVLNPAPVAVGDAACAQQAVAGNVTYTRPGATFGPYNLPKYTSLNNLRPASERLSVPALALTYNFPSFSVKLDSSYVMDQGDTVSPNEQTQVGTNLAVNATYGSIFIPKGLPYLAQWTDNNGVGGTFITRNERKAVTEELRFTSNDDPGNRLTWVAGLYYSADWIHSRYINVYRSLDALAEAAYGMTALQRYGVPSLPLTYDSFFGGDLSRFGGVIFDHEDQKIHDLSLAAYAEGNYNVTDDLKLTVGLRESLSKLGYKQSFYGPVDSVDTPSFATQSKSKGKSSETAFTPKVGLTYHFTQDDLVYANAAKGFRPGGVNAHSSQNICGPAFALYGLTVNDQPPTYKSDSVWSYELGAKLRLLNGRAQLNGDVYHIDWSNIQVSQGAGPGCGIVFTANAGSAISQGVELEAQALLFHGLSLDAAFTYDDAHYTQNAVAIHGPLRDFVVALKGQKFAIPPWTLSVGARYDFLVANLNPYVRVDLRYAAAYDNSVYPVSYSPDTNHVDPTTLVNLRMGIDYDAYDVNFFVENLLNYESSLPTGGGRGGCKNASCTSYTNYNPYMTATAAQPRTIGLQLIYRN